jgi:hypothetical protein
MFPEPKTQGPTKPRMVALVASLAVAGVISLSIHVVMLQVLGIPFPEANAPRWASYLNLAGSTTALIAFQIVAQKNIDGWWRTIMISSLILFMFKESLRGVIMNGVVTTAWVFALAGIVAPLLLCIGVATLCAVFARRVRSPTGLVLAGLTTGGLAIALQAIVGVAVSPLMAALASQAHPDIYQLPYPASVLIPAYLTFAEPVIGCCLMAAFIWGQLASGFPARLIIFTVLVVFLKGVVIRTIVYPGYMALPLVQGVVSQSQFLLEFAVLGVLTGTAWHLFGHQSSTETPFAWPTLRRPHG